MVVAGCDRSTMPVPPPVRLVVELDSVAPVQGLVRREGRDDETFIGWMALTQAIDLLSHPPSAE
jgi:hypothetical protein